MTGRKTEENHTIEYILGSSKRRVKAVTPRMLMGKRKASRLATASSLCREPWSKATQPNKTWWVCRSFCDAAFLLHPYLLIASNTHVRFPFPRSRSRRLSSCTSSLLLLPFVLFRDWHSSRAGRRKMKEYKRGRWDSSQCRSPILSSFDLLLRSK